MKTNTELQAARHAQKRPDISFDLDGDNFVGNRDYVIAKLFDKDGDGKLNKEERAAADEAVRNVSFKTLYFTIFTLLVGYRRQILLEC